MTKIFKGLMVLGLFFIALSGYFVVIAISSLSWDQVQGKIINTRTPTSIINAGSPTQRSIVYRVEVTYKYEVNGKPYKNSRFSTGTGDTIKRNFSTKTKARDWIKNSDYSTGKKVTVYVNPDDPENTVLSAGINIGTIAPFFIGFLFFITGYLLNKKIPNVAALK